MNNCLSIGQSKGRKQKMKQEPKVIEFNTTRKYDYKFNIYVYPKVVLAIVNIKDNWGKENDKRTILFSRKIYNKNKDKKSLHWVLRIKADDQLVIVNQDYMNYYLADPRFEYPRYKNAYIPDKLWKNILDSNDFERVVYDQIWNDGMMYDVNNKPILRTFHFDYVRSHIGNNTHNINATVKWLKKQKTVTNVNIVEVPYYNQDKRGDKSVEFDFTPTKQFFKRMMALEDAFNRKDTFNREQLVRDHLQLNKFEKVVSVE